MRAFPADFLRGLFHSDGCRVANWATRMVGGARKRYDYPRWQFVNASEDILDLCTWALDLVDVAWRRSGPRVVSVEARGGRASRRADRSEGLSRLRPGDRRRAPARADAPCACRPDVGPVPLDQVK